MFICTNCVKCAQKIIKNKNNINFNYLILNYSKFEENYFMLLLTYTKRI